MIRAAFVVLLALVVIRWSIDAGMAEGIQEIEWGVRSALIFSLFLLRAANA
ncbi:hypothetical protein PRN20_22240 [Devosia sp. ZB163]|jgi:hypothetical protein|uniref:hypothetical protein n=1 Tax=Devosia sp. ZB163 TaxID=3025938 RepID=UPI00235DFB8F|nr:hypothetical protein [Devosia sp. ZB163]MDC9826466.1 hypothetical protein [Devosia sp. ZB163]